MNFGQQVGNSFSRSSRLEILHLGLSFGIRPQSLRGEEGVLVGQRVLVGRIGECW